MRTEQASELDMAGRGCAAENGGNLGKDDLDVLVLAYEGVGSGVERAKLRVAFLRAGQQQARYSPQRRVEANAADQGRPIHSRQHTVDHDGARPPVGDGRRPSSPLAAVSTR